MRLPLNDRRPDNLSWLYSMDQEPGQPFCLYNCNGNGSVDSQDIYAAWFGHISVLVTIIRVNP